MYSWVAEVGGAQEPWVRISAIGRFPIIRNFVANSSFVEFTEFLEGFWRAVMESNHGFGEISTK